MALNPRNGRKREKPREAFFRLASALARAFPLSSFVGEGCGEAFSFMRWPAPSPARSSAQRTRPPATARSDECPHSEFLLGPARLEYFPPRYFCRSADASIVQILLRSARPA